MIAFSAATGLGNERSKTLLAKQLNGSKVDLGNLEASYVHKCASLSNATLPSDIFGRLIREHDLLAKPLLFEGKDIVVPDGPGLGVELDIDAVAKYKTDNRVVA